MTWQDAAGNVYGQPPVKDADYALDTGDGWDYNETDGFYYYKNTVDPEKLTTNLIDSCEVKTAAPDSNYSLHVEILAQAIQAEGVTNATDHINVWTQAKATGN